MPFRYTEAMVEPPEERERDLEKEFQEKEDYMERMYDRDLIEKEGEKK